MDIDILSDEFFIFVADQIQAPDWRPFFIQLGLKANRCDHWEDDNKNCLKGAITCGLKEWRQARLNEDIPCNKNVSEIKSWIIEALEKCHRNDLVHDLGTCKQDMDKIIDILSDKVTSETKVRFYAFLGIDPDKEEPTLKLKEKTRTSLETWLETQSKKFWKYQELLCVFRKQENISAISAIEDKFNIKEIKYQQDSQKSVPFRFGPFEQQTQNKRSLDSSEANIQGEPLTKQLKKDKNQKAKDSTTKVIGPEQSSSDESLNVTNDTEMQEIIYNRCKIAPERKDEYAESNNMETDSQIDTMTDMQENEEIELELRDYQQELAELGLKGVNTIICAGPNSGKTCIAIHIIEKHLEQNQNGTIAFIAKTNVLLDQQYKLACKFLPTLKRNGKIRKWQDADKVTCETFKNMTKECSIIFVTPQSMCNFLEEESENLRVELNQFTLLVLDECHHTFKKSPYNGIMRHYRRLKYGRNSSKLPQILGLTASPGTNKSKNVVSAKEHLKLVMANLGVLKLSVVQKNKSSLLDHSSIPERVYIPSTERKQDPVHDLLHKAVVGVETLLSCQFVSTFLREHIDNTIHIRKALSDKPDDKTTESYIQWIVETRKAVEQIKKTESTIPRFLHACLRHLEFYAECLEINSLLDFIDVKTFFGKEYTQLTEESGDAIDRDLIIILEEAYSAIVAIGGQIERNPNIKELIKTLQKEYDEHKDESRFLVFVKTRKTAKALAEKMPEYFKSQYLTGSQASGDDTGLSRKKQSEIVDKFRKGEHMCLVTTSVAAEGLHIEKCTVEIRYRLMSNEISSVQMRGRVRQKGGKNVMLGNQKEFEKESVNLERQYLMQEAIKCVLLEDVRDEIVSKERTIFATEKAERNIQIINPNEKNRGQFLIGCKKCVNDYVIVDGQYIRRIKQTHSIVVDKVIFSKIERKRRDPKPIDAKKEIELSDKVFGAVSGCKHEWGSILTYKGCEFVSLSQDKIRILEKGTNRPQLFKKWLEVCLKFPIADITDEEISNYISQPIPPTLEMQ